MKKLKSLLFRRLPNAAHFEFCSQVSNLLSTADKAVLAKLGDLPARFNAWFNKELALMEWVRKSYLTSYIAEANRRQERVLVAINTQVRALKYSTTPDIAETARGLYIMLKNYGTVYLKPYDEQEGDICAILNQLTGKYAPSVTLLGLGAPVTELQDAFTDFQQFLTQRNAKLLQKPGETAVVIRRNIEAVYHQITVRVNAGAVLNASPGFAALIDALNPEIERLNAEFHHVRHNIAHAEPKAIPVQTYTGEPLTPTPDVYYTTPKDETVKLILGKDYNLTYRHNKKVGSAECTIRGKGLYRGNKTITFNILPAGDLKI
jgi:hypothetical protein